MTDDNEIYTLTPFGLISMEFGDDAARAVLDRIELYLRRHYGSPSAIVFDGDSFSFSSLQEASA